MVDVNGADGRGVRRQATDQHQSIQVPYDGLTVARTADKDIVRSGDRETSDFLQQKDEGTVETH